MSLIDLRILEENIVTNPDKVVEPKELDKDDTIITPNVSIEDQSQVPEIKNPVNTSSLSQSELEKLEDKINIDSEFIDDAIVECFYELNRDIITAQTLLESLSIDAINKQYQILSECAYDSDEYSDKISVLVEASGKNILATLVELIQNFIEKVKKWLSTIGVQISVSFANYEKWTKEKASSLMDKASKSGSQVKATIHKWNDELLFKPLKFKQIEYISEDFVPHTSDKEKMKEIIEKITDKYESQTDLANDVYTHALARAIGEKPDDRILDNKELAYVAAKTKYCGKEKDVYMDTKTTGDFIQKLHDVKSRTSSCFAAMRSNDNTDEFVKLIKDARKEMQSREDNTNTTKYRYFSLRFTVLSSIQNAINDIYKLKCQCMKEYSKELYSALKTLDGFKVDVNTESIDFETASDYIGSTLHE